MQKGAAERAPPTVAELEMLEELLDDADRESTLLRTEMLTRKQEAEARKQELEKVIISTCVSCSSFISSTVRDAVAQCGRRDGSGISLRNTGSCAFSRSCTDTDICKFL